MRWTNFVRNNEKKKNKMIDYDWFYLVDALYTASRGMMYFYVECNYA